MNSDFHESFIYIYIYTEEKNPWHVSTHFPLVLLKKLNNARHDLLFYNKYNNNIIINLNKQMINEEELQHVFEVIKSILHHPYQLGFDMRPITLTYQNQSSLNASLTKKIFCDSSPPKQDLTHTNHVPFHCIATNSNYKLVTSN